MGDSRVFKYHKKTLIYGLITLSVVSLFFLPSQMLSPLKFKFIAGASLPVRIISFPLLEIKKILFYHRTYADYIKLQKDYNTLKARLIGMEEVIRENNRLENLLKFKRSLVYSSVGASVVGRDPSNWNETVIIDKGALDDVAVGMPAVNAQGVVGKVAEVSDRKSKVILLTDPGFSTAALVKRSREIGLVSGTLQGLCRMRYLSANADVNVGDQVITSKLSSSFPEGLFIGEVIAVEHKKNGLSVDCIIQPAVPLSQLEEILIIRTR